MEQEVNDILMKGYKAADYQYRSGYKTTGDLIIGLTSQLALHLIKAWNLNGKVVCRTCETEIKDAIGRDYVREFNGDCMSCDHMYGKIVQESWDQAGEGRLDDEFVN